MNVTGREERVIARFENGALLVAAFRRDRHRSLCHHHVLVAGVPVGRNCKPGLELNHPVVRLFRRIASKERKLTGIRLRRFRVARHPVERVGGRNLHLTLGECCT